MFLREADVVWTLYSRSSYMDISKKFDSGKGRVLFYFRDMAVIFFYRNNTHIFTMIGFHSSFSFTFYCAKQQVDSFSNLNAEYTTMDKCFLESCGKTFFELKLYVYVLINTHFSHLPSFELNI